MHYIPGDGTGVGSGVGCGEGTGVGEGVGTIEIENNQKDGNRYRVGFLKNRGS